MKTYQQVVQERYNHPILSKEHFRNQYALINPVGYYTSTAQRKLFYRIFNLLRSKGLDLEHAQILDFGCGSGATTRMFMEFTHAPENISGLDLSEVRIAQAKHLHPAIDYAVADIVDFTDTRQFHLITSLDVFMHLSTEEEIVLALDTIRKLMAPGAYFIWYDAYARDHFDTTEKDDHKGFHPRQMDELAGKAGLVPVARYQLFRILPGRHNSPYLTRKFPAWMVRMLEMIYPGPPGNIIRIYQKG